MFVLDKQAFGQMEDGGQRENKRQSVDYYKIPSWNMLPHYQAEEQNAFDMNAKISMIYYERDAAIEERDRFINEKKVALEERNIAVQQRDTAYTERDNALRERDNVIAALQFQEMGVSGSRGLKWINHPTHRHFIDVQSDHISKGGCAADAFPVTTNSAEDTTKSHETKKKMKKTVATKPPKKAKKLGEDLNRHVTTDGSKAEWAQDFGIIHQIQFDQTCMPVPVCSCTGVPRLCYKWGSGGWQSSCCTTTLSVYPLPQMPNKRHARMGGRKMSGSVFSRLLTRLVATGHDVSKPVDLKNYWAKHGTNRFVTIK